MGMLSKFEEAVQAKMGVYTPDGRSAMNRSADCKKVAMCEAKQHGRGVRADTAMPPSDALVEPQPTS